MRLHERLRAGTFPNYRKLADELEVSTKTIQRDIDFMRDRLGLYGEEMSFPATAFLKMPRGRSPSTARRCISF